MEDEWILQREPGDTDEDYRAAVEFWRREFNRTDRNGVSVSEHLKSGRAVLVEMVLPE